MKIIDNLKKNKVLSAGIGYTIGNYLLKGINFLTVPLFARLMSTADYGMYNSYIAYESLLCIFSALALHTSLKSARLEYKEKFEDYLSSIIYIPIFICLILLAVCNAFFPVIGVMLELRRPVLCILIIHSFASSVLTIYNNWLGLSYNYKTFLKISFLNVLLNLSLSLLLILTIFSEERYLGRIIGTAFPLFCISVMICCQILKGKRKWYNVEYWKFGLKYSIPIIPHGVSQILLSQFDRLMIQKMIGASEAGIYSFAYNINQIVAVLTNSLDTVWGPWFFEQMEKKNYDNIRRRSRIYVYGMFCAISIIIILSPEIIMIMGGEKYIDGKYCVIPLLMSTFFIFLYTIPAQVEYFHKKTQLISLATICAAIINIVLNWIFILRVGYIAAAYTTLVSYILYFIFHFIMARKIDSKMKFDAKLIGLLSCFIIGIGAYTLVFIDHMVIRFLTAFVFVVINGMIVYVIFKDQLPFRKKDSL